MTDDPYDLERFVTAQDPIYERALAELRRASKAGHWMWFIFPQIAGLGFSDMAERYGISSLDEARAYLRHQVLGPRLRACADVVAGTTGRTAEQIFGGIDAMKLRSSMTLFRGPRQRRRCSRRCWSATLTANPIRQPMAACDSRRSEDAELAGAGERLDPVAGAELLQRPLQVRLDGVAGQPERRGDLGVRLAHRDVPQDVVLAPGQSVLRSLRLSSARCRRRCRR